MSAHDFFKPQPKYDGGTSAAVLKHFFVAKHKTVGRTQAREDGCPDAEVRSVPSVALTESLQHRLSMVRLSKALVVDRSAQWNASCSAVHTDKSSSGNTWTLEFPLRDRQLLFRVQHPSI